jgi:hypothetical protein
VSTPVLIRNHIDAEPVITPHVAVRQKEDFDGYVPSIHAPLSYNNNDCD